MSTSLIGQTTEDPTGNVRRLTYVGVPLEVGPNVIAWGDETVTVYRVGDTRQVEVKPVQLIADGSTLCVLLFAPWTLSATSRHRQASPYAPTWKSVVNPGAPAGVMTFA
ncbi:hypothetical protein ACFSC4_14565 [Deinococcus malanensis]|uniref:hypothetical protein n=1 Tax=Deinococcus malanensis TaxID=1706855 RepID=UPI0036321126